MEPIKVLLVDDSAQFLEAERGVVIVGQANSVADAIEKIESLQPDVVLMEVAMAGMSGLEATRRIKARAAPPRILLLSMYDSVEYRSAAVSAGADGFVGKWEFVDRILSAIEAAMRP